MGITDCEFSAPPGDGWQKLPSVEVRAIGPLAAGGIGLPLYGPGGCRADAVTVPFQLQAAGAVYNLDMEVTVPAFEHLGGGAKLKDILATLVAGETCLFLRLEKTHVRNK